MKKFSREEYLAHPEKKVVTRDGRTARVICTNRKFGYPLIALAYNADEDKEVYINATVFGIAQCERKDDLFFADEEPELTEFEKLVSDAVEYDTSIDSDEEVELVKKEYATELLKLARKELARQGNIVLTVEEFEKRHMEAQEVGRKEALKDLPRWKPAARAYEGDRLPRIDWLLKRLVAKFEEGIFYLDMNDLYKLPGFKGDESHE